MDIHRKGFKRSLKRKQQNYQNHQIPNLPQKTKKPKIPHEKAPFSNSNGIKRPDEKKGEGEYFSSLRENKILGWDLTAL